jgi:hypothetical protein
VRDEKPDEGSSRFSKVARGIRGEAQQPLGWTQVVAPVDRSDSVQNEAVQTEQERPQSPWDKRLDNQYNTAIPQHRPDIPAATRFNAVFVLGTCFAAIFLVFSFTARFRVLYKDDWDWVAPLLVRMRFSDYVFLGGNEHIILIPRILMWWDHHLNGLPGPLMWAAGMGSYLLTSIVILEHQWRRSDLPPIVARAATGATLALLFFTYQLQVFLSPAGVTIPLVVALSLAALVSTIRAVRQAEHGQAWWWYAAAGVCAVASILTSGQGLAAPFALIAIILVVRGIRVGSLTIGLGLCAAVVWLYVRTTGVHAPAVDLYSAVVVTSFGLAFLAGPVSYASVTIGVLSGAAALAAGIREASVVVRRGRASSDCQLLCLGLMVFVLITAALTAMARAHFGVAQASQSRYALFAMLYLSAALTLWTIRMLESQAGRRRFHNASIIAIGLMVIALPIDLFVGTVWWAKAENARAAARALQVRVQDFEWIRTLHPNPSRPYELSRLIETSGPEASPLATPGSLPRCPGDIRLQPMDGGRFFRIRGHLAGSSASTLRLQDNSGATRGLAGRAPVVNVPDPTYGQVIAAVWHGILRGRLHEGEWLGFALPGAGPPYRAVVSEQGTILCAAPVAVL